MRLPDLNHWKRRNSRIAVVFIAVLALGAGGFVAGRHLASAPAEAGNPASPLDLGTISGSDATPPGPDVTPVPGSTPDTTKPFWFIPYANAERDAPKFHGTLNGIEFGAQSGALPACAKPATPDDWKKAVAGTFYDLKLDSLPDGVEPREFARVGKCADDGRPIWIIAEVHLEGITGVNNGGGSIQISRWEAVRWYPQEFPPERFSTGTIAGRPAVFADSFLPVIGVAAVVVSDAENGGSTMLLGNAVSVDVLKQVAEALYK